MRMIGKLGKDKKANWPGHLAEIVHAYNATCSAMTGYSPHYLMFGWRPRLPVNFYFPIFRSAVAPHKRGLHPTCGWIHGYCPWPIEDHPSGGSGPIDSRSPMTEMVLWLKDRCHGSEAWWSGLSEGLMPLRERGRLGIGGKMRHVRWWIRSQQTSPPTKW